MSNHEQEYINVPEDPLKDLRSMVIKLSARVTLLEEELRILKEIHYGNVHSRSG